PPSPPCDWTAILMPWSFAVTGSKRAGIRRPCRSEDSSWSATRTCVSLPLQHQSPHPIQLNQRAVDDLLAGAEFRDRDRQARAVAALAYRLDRREVLLV